MIVVGQGNRNFVVLPARQEPDLNHDLKSIADPDHRHASFRRFEQLGHEPLPGVHRFDASGCDIVAIREPAWESDEVKRCDLRGFGEEAIQVDQLHVAPSECQCPAELDIAVGPGGSDHECFGHGHIQS